MAEETGHDSELNSGKHGATRVDPERIRASFTRLMEIYRGISETADNVAIGRCPYKDARSRCTAKFDCRNQHFVPNKPGEPAICVGSDKLDYRKAWQTD